MLHIQFCERIDQLINDGKGEVTAFELTCEEFRNQIFEVTLYPDLRYLFVDLSECTFKNNSVYFNL